MELSRGPSSATSSDEVMNGQRALGNAPPFHQNNHAHAHNQSHSHSHAHAHAQQQQQQQALHHRIFRPEISTQRCPDAVRKAAAITASSAKPSMPADAFERFQQQQQQSREFRNPSLYAAVNGNGRHRHRHRHDDDDEEEDDDDEEEDDASDDEDDGGGDDDDGGMDGMVAPSSNSGAGENVLDVFQKTPNLGVMKQGHHHPSLGMFLSPPFLNTFSQGGHAGMLGEPSQNGAAVAAYFKGATAAPRMPGAQDGAMAAAAAAESDNYYTQLLQSGGPLSHKDPDVDDASASAAGGPFAADRKVSGGAGSTSSDTPEISLRGILSDPITGALMDDASILLTCGHSFGSVTIQNCLEMRSCATCGQSISSDSVAPNHSLRAAVQAYRREDEFQSMSSKSSKRRREKYEQDKSSYSDSMSLDCARGKGVQFPFVVNDRVIIKGNKRTPERFVGREAVITTQCLNGWYVVKTLDNAESVKLQYRSLEKVGEHQPLNELSQKAIGPSWLVNN